MGHIYGRKHLSEEEKTLKGDKLYRWLIRKNFPSGYQILCMNCNFAKGKCSHELEKMKK